MPDAGSAAPSLQALIVELGDQLEKLPACSPDEVDALMARLGERLEAFAAGLNADEATSPDELRQAQTLLGNYAGQLGRAMGRVERGLDVFGLSEPVYREPNLIGPRNTGAARTPRTSVAA